MRGAALCDSVLSLHFTYLCRSGSVEFVKKELEETEALTQPSRIELPNELVMGFNSEGKNAALEDQIFKVHPAVT
jgi:hypothetical protein